jgi:hypothetical protein
MAQVTRCTIRHVAAICAGLSPDGECACARGTTIAAPGARGRGETSPIACWSAAMCVSVSAAHAVQITHGPGLAGST